MNILNTVMQHPYLTLGAIGGLPFLASWIGAHVGARTGTSEFRRNYRRPR
jgi:hypothetical protein